MKSANISFKALRSICLISVFLLGFITIVATGGGRSTDSSGRFVYEYNVPDSLNDGWQVAHINDVNIDETLITQMVQDIHDGDFPRIDSVAIVKDGLLVLDHRFRTELDEFDEDVGNTNIDLHHMMSATKSVLSALVGIAIDQGLIAGVDDSFYSYFTEYSDFDNWSPLKDDITIADALTMRHGLEWDEWTYPYGDSRNTLTYVSSYPDVVKAVLDLPMANTPGEVFAYSSGISLALGELVANASGKSIEDFADEYLFEPLGITQRIWYYTGAGQAHTGSGLYLTTRSMAKFGQLYLDNGWWNGQQIISSEWIALSTQQQVDTSSISVFEGWAMHWNIKDFNVDGDWIHTYTAAGNGGQFVFVIPGLNTVVVLTGQNYTTRGDYEQYGEHPFIMMREYILPAIEGT